MSEENHLNYRFTDNYHEMMDHLHHAQGVDKMKADDSSAIYKYTGDSSTLNRSLVAGLYPADLDRNGPHNSKIHSVILDNAAHTPEPFHVYTGSNVNFVDMAKQSRNNIVHLPAHVSTSLNIDKAKVFGSNVSRITIQPKDKSLAIGKISRLSGEHEVIIPAGTRLKYSHHNDDGIAHFTIHSQVKVPTFEEDPGAAIDSTVKQISKNPNEISSGYLHRFVSDNNLANHFNEDRVHSLVGALAQKKNQRPTDLLTLSNEPSIRTKLNPERLVSSALATKNPAEAAFAIKHKSKAISDDDLSALHRHAKKNEQTYTSISPDQIENPIDAKHYKEHILKSKSDNVAPSLAVSVLRHSIRNNPSEVHKLLGLSVFRESVGYMERNHPIHDDIRELDKTARDHLYQSVISEPNIHPNQKSIFAEFHGLSNSAPNSDLEKSLCEHVPVYMAAHSARVNELLPSLIKHSDTNDTYHLNKIFLGAFNNPHTKRKEMIEAHADHFTHSLMDRLPSSTHHEIVNTKTLRPHTRVKLMSHEDLDVDMLSPNSINTLLDHFDTRPNDTGIAKLGKSAYRLTHEQKTKYIEKTKKDPYLQSRIINNLAGLSSEHLDHLVQTNPSSSLERIFNHLDNVPGEFISKHLGTAEAQESPALNHDHITEIVKGDKIVNPAIFRNRNFSNEHAEHIIEHGSAKSKNALASTNDFTLNKDQVDRLHRSGVPLKTFLDSGSLYDSDTVKHLYEKSKKDPESYRHARSVFSSYYETPPEILNDILQKPNSVRSHENAVLNSNLNNEGIEHAIKAGIPEVSRRYGLNSSQISKVIDRFPEDSTGDNEKVIRDLNNYNETGITGEHVHQMLDKHPSSPHLAWSNRAVLDDSHLERIITNPKSGIVAMNAMLSGKASPQLVNKMIMGKIAPHRSSIEEARKLAVTNRNFNNEHLSNLLADHKGTDADLIKHAINNSPMAFTAAHVEAAKKRPDSEELLKHMKTVREDLFDNDMEKSR